VLEGGRLVGVVTREHLLTLVQAQLALGRGLALMRESSAVIHPGTIKDV